MGKLSLIIFTFIFIIAIQESCGQRSATAIMKVSVHIVQGSSIETKQPDFISMRSTNRSNIGQLNLKGINSEYSLISISKSLNIEDEEGKNINMDVSSEQIANGGGIIYNLFGSTSQILENGMYYGKLTATIEHL